MHAAVELSAALGMNEGTVTASIELGLELRHRLHRTREAFATGRIDLAQARVISAMLTGVSDAALDILESAVLEGGNVPPTTLRVRCRRLIAKHDPGSLRRRAKLAAADRDVRVRPAENGMSFVDGHLPAADAHTIGMRLREMAIHDVCTGDPRTLAQRRADALTALADGSGRLLCRCLDVGCHTRTRPAPTRRAPLIRNQRRNTARVGRNPGPPRRVRSHRRRHRPPSRRRRSLPTRPRPHRERRIRRRQPHPRHQCHRETPWRTEGSDP
ncbi:DUF222 domain-containing protein [Rhodococcus sp. ZPP]|nr:DUF222 domain-containing protein [Rhodococcus sp. ZPP]